MCGDHHRAAHVEHPAAERHGRLPLVCYAFRCRRDGIPAQLVTHHPRAQPWAIPEQGPPEAPAVDRELGNLATAPVTAAVLRLYLDVT